METCPSCEQSFPEASEYCPHCGVRQSAVDQGFGATEEKIPTGWRIAGGVLLGNAAVVLATAVLGIDSGPVNPFASAVFDVVIGATLLAGSRKLVVWARVRLILGAIVFTGVFLAQGDVFSGGMQVAYCCAVLALLVGRPGTLRTVAALVPIGGMFALELLGLQQIATGRNLLTSAFAHVNYDLVELDGRPVQGIDAPYWFGPVGPRWQLRSGDDAAADNPDVDLWFVRPDRDAHVLVIAEEVAPGEVVDQDLLSEFVVSNLEGAADGVEVIEKRPIRAAEGVYGELIEARGTVDDLRFRYRIGCFAHGRFAIQVFAFAGEGAFDDVSDELTSAIRSLTFDPPA